MADSSSLHAKVLIVEGKTDKDRLLEILREPVEILCTQGTLSYEKIESLILPLQGEDVYILVDADDSGDKLRNQLKQELPNARHLYTRRMYREVARTPMEVLAKVLQDAYFEVDERWLTPQSELEAAKRSTGRWGAGGKGARGDRWR